MAKGEEYPLEQVIDIKKKRVQEAEKALEEAKRVLEQAEEKLEKIKAARDKVKKHEQEKLLQMRQALDEGTTSDEIIGMKNYLKVVKEQLLGEEKKVEDQQKVVEEKKQAVEDAKAVVKEKQKEVDKLLMHKDHWSEELKKELEKKEASEQDELGSMMYLANRKKRK